ncbi:MAG: hypothetical protein E7146_05925 [Rikenellaceae bacterium]|nr:hypothetical protein [Rikenellaceae bacterium]
MGVSVVNKEFIIEGFEGVNIGRPVVVTIGSFDGVHCGHRILIQRAKAMASRLGCATAVVTFDPHPRIAMGRGEGMGLLTTLGERALLLRREGVDYMVVAKFDEAFRQQHYADFVANSLVSGLGMRGMIVGYNHRLGRGSEGSYATLLPLSERYGFDIECVDQHTLQGAKVSSTVVRNLILEGDMSRVCELLGRGYIVMGHARQGVLELSSTHKLLPPSGRYSVDVDSRGVVTAAVATIEDRSVVLDVPLSGDVVLSFNGR